MNLHVEPPHKYDGRFPRFSEPREIGRFSVDGGRNYCNDTSQLKYLELPRKLSDISLDLNIGFSEAIRKDSSKTEKLYFLLKWITTHSDEVNQHFQMCKAVGGVKYFVCYRGLLTVICNTIYENKDDWIICATKFKSVIYLCALDTEQDIKRRENMSLREKQMCAWGYKFEQYLTSDEVNSNPNTVVPVNEKEEYDAVLRGRLGDHPLLFSAEVDGVDPAYFQNPHADPTSTRRYIELKTSRIISNKRQNDNFGRYKLIKWWLQSFLIGIPDVICGFRDDDGIVRNINVLKVKDMPKLAGSQWSGSACFNFCAHFLSYVKQCVQKDDPYVVYKFYWKPGATEIKCEELVKPPAEYQILPDWFIEKDHLRKKQKT